MLYAVSLLVTKGHVFSTNCYSAFPKGEKKSVTEKHKVTLPSLVLRNYDEKETLGKGRSAFSQLSISGLPTQSQKGQEVDSLMWVLGEESWGCLGALRKYLQSLLHYSLFKGRSLYFILFFWGGVCTGN